MISNTITFTVLEYPEVSENTISAPKTTLLVNEEVTITGSVSFTTPIPEAPTYYLYVVIYVNDTPIDYYEAAVRPGSISVAYNFILSFSEPGTYTVYTDAYVYSR